MNYLSHGRKFLEKPYVMAGTAVPDWLRVIDRTNRVRGKNAQPWVGCDEPHIADVASGVLQHLSDDRWFHETRAFAELSLEFTRQIRDLLEADGSMRPSFVGHILVELLLDWVIADENSGLLDSYYAALESVDPLLVEEAVSRIALRPTTNLAPLIGRFCAERFLCDYATDGKLLWRLNMVMRRVGLPDLPPHFCHLLPEARRVVRQRKDELLIGERE